MRLIYLIFHICLSLRLLDVCRILNSNVRGQSGNLSDILLCSETLVSNMLHVSELLVSGFGRPALVCSAECLGPEGWLLMYEMDTKHFATPI